MINARKGTAHSLSQSDWIASVKPSEGVVAGMLIRIDPTSYASDVATAGTKGSLAALPGYAVKAGAAASATLTDPVNQSRYGFAVTNQDEGDALESGVIGAYGLDGNSVIETDQVATTITSTNFPIGALIGPDATATGLIRNVTAVANAKVLGSVSGIRTIRGTTVLAVKLAA